MNINLKYLYNILTSAKRQKQDFYACFCTKMGQREEKKGEKEQ
jgi:hypothetical protein